MTNLLLNQHFLLFFTIFIGQLIGKIKIRKFGLNSSGVLFFSLFFSFLLTKLTPNLVNQQLVSKNIFDFSLILFLTAVGLLAAPNLTYILKKFGLKFIILAATITTTPFLLIKLIMLLFSYDPFLLKGLFIGSLTSSPAIASALELVNFENQQTLSSAYIIAYLPGVFGVIFAVFVLPKIFKINIKQEQLKLKKKISLAKNEFINYDITALSLVICSGILFGQFKLKLMGFNFNLGMTGACLVSSLFYGSLGRIGKLDFHFNTTFLKSLQTLGLSMFFSYLGLNHGAATITNLSVEFMVYFFVAVLIVITAIMSGFFVGRYLLKMNWVLLIGAICGGMTSTPGLGVAIEKLNSNFVIISYAATYPIALIFMIIFSKLNL